MYPDYYSRIQIHALFFNSFVFGTGYTNNHGVLLLAGYKHRYLSTQVGYDFGISKLSGNTAGSFELHLSFNLRRKTERDSVVAFERW